VRNIVIVTPGSTIQRKTVANLTPGHPKFLRGLQCRPTVITLDNFENGTVAGALDDPDAMKVFVFTVQSLLRPNTKDARRAHRDHETLGQSLSDYLAAAPDLVVIADEHHIYASTGARKFSQAITALDPAALIGLTATPDDSTPLDRIVFHYPLADAIADGFVKVPVLVARSDRASDTRTQLADGVALLDAKASAMTAYCKTTRKEFVQPVLFVVASTIAEARDIRDMLAGPDLLGNPDQVLLVTSDEPDETLRLLDTLEEPGSPIRGVVSVSMLKEGWDVRNIYVIAAVRALESQLLTEQVLGRGLRLPFGARTGVGMLDTVEVLSHHAFAELLAQAEVLLSQTLGQRADQATATVQTAPGQAGTATKVSELPGGAPIADPVGPQVVITLPGQAGAGTLPGQGTLFDTDAGSEIGGPVSHEVGGIATVGARIAAGQATAATLATTLHPRSPNGVRIPMFIPRVTTRWVRDPFSLTHIDTTAVEALGRQFADDNGPTLTRKALDAERAANGAVHVVATDVSADAAVTASQLRLPFNTIETDLVTRLMNSNAVAATTSEMNAATNIAGAFLTGVGVTEDTPWRAEHGRLASAALVDWLGAKQTSSPARQVAEVVQVRWPDPVERVEANPPANRNVVTKAAQFVRGYPYSGWVRSIYEVVSFDSWSAEFRLAELLDRTPGVAAWVRVKADVPLHIGYTTGAITRTYVPDFIVIDTHGVHWIVEGKANAEMTDSVVLAKRDAAKAWVDAVNASDDVQDSWAYALASEAAIGAAGSWAALLAASQTHK
jgi:type III restriction enzyme